MAISNLFKMTLFLLIILAINDNVYAFSNYDEAYDEAVNLAHIAEKLEQNGQFDEAMDYYKKTEKIFSEVDDESNVAATKSKIGVVYGKKGDYDIALDYFQKAREIHHKFNDLPSEISTIGNSGKIYLLKDDLDRAFLHFNEAYEMSQKIEYKHGEGLALANIGIYYTKKGNNILAIEYHQKAFDIFMNANSLYNAGHEAIILSFSYSQFGKWSEAERYVEHAKTIFENLNDKSGMNYVLLNSGLIHYGIANYYLSIDDFQQSFDNFILAEEEFKKVINLPQAKFSYSYTLMREGDLFSRNNSHDKAINKFDEAIDTLHSISINDCCNKQSLLDVKTLIIAKINFEKGIIEAEKLNFAEAAKYFEKSENKFKQISNATSMIDKKNLITGYFYYSGSKKNYFIYKTTADEDHRTLAQDSNKKASVFFEKAGFHDLTRTVIEEKMINFPESFIPYIDDMILFEGLGFQKIQFNESIKTFETDYITFNYGYIFAVPYTGLPAIKFCCEEFCSEWVKIFDNEIRESKIKIRSSYPRKIDCDINIYSENRPEISIGKMEALYYPTFKLEPIIQDDTISLVFKENYPYRKVSINIEKSLWEKLKEFLDLPASIFGIIGFSIIGILTFIYKKRDNIKKTIKTINNKIAIFIKKATTYLKTVKKEIINAPFP